MKVYTITFHWATNYGAVLQSYALQKYLLSQGIDTKIINYIPKGQKKTLLKAFRARSSKQLLAQLREYKKECKIEKFRKQHLLLTELFDSNTKLRNTNWEDSSFVCGSDQIWNPYFTLKGEGKVTTTYYLDFVPAENKRISYAASFGVSNLEENVVSIVKPWLNRFSYISVREKSATRLLDTMGCKSMLVCDPVFLLGIKEYEELFESKNELPNDALFEYILHQNQENAYKVSEYVSEYLKLNRIEKMTTLGIEEWLEKLARSAYVVTNSFHAIAFSVIFHKPFIAVLIKESGMNDRILTLLEKVGLQNRAILSCEKENIDKILSSTIDWERVDSCVKELSRFSGEQLMRAIMEEKDAK